ncbi:MAG: glucose 1-dehydrogenase [Oscillospiraceae bacterium]|nr:glucose 1-dehydrogenase [Oscillospiraceae bacterium]
MGKLDGKVAIITGSTSGMGRDTAYLFAKEGAKVVVTGRNEERAKAVVEKIRAEGGEAVYVIADAADKDYAQVIFEKTMEAYGTVDILMNNAGMLSLAQFATVTAEEFMEDINVNVTSALMLSQKVAPVMQAKGDGHIINIASIVGWAAHWGFVAYVTSKHAMVGLTKAMANELAPTIHVNGICPGAIKTAMLDSVGGEEVFQPMIERTCLRRVGEGSEIATAALFLATTDSSFIDGQLLRVDGGVDV